MATLNYNRIAICIVSVIVLWVLAAAFRSHSSLSLQDLKDIAKGISVSTGFGGKGKTQEDDLIDHLEIDDSVPPPTVHTSTETSWGQGTGYDGYDEYDILPPGVHDLEAAEEEFKEHHQHTAPFGGESTNKWGEDNIDDYYDPIVPGHDASGTSNLHGTENGEKPSWEGQTSSSSSGSKESSHHSSGGSTKDWTLHDFQKAYLHHELGGDSGKELQRACANAAFSGNVVMHMLHVRGGLTNVRAGILDLVWFAILTGSDLVLPQYIIRPDATAPHNWDDESLGYYGLENMFDREWFLEFMGKHCPQMTIYPEINAVPYTTMFEHSEGFSDARYYLELSNTEAQLINTFNMWLHGFSDFQPNGVNLVFVNKMLWDFNWIPRPRLRKDMGHLLRISPEIRELAATALYNLRTEMHLDTIQPDAQIYDDAYLAVHLRTEPDAQQMGWTNDYGGFEMQSDHYIEECKKLGLDVIYVASGSQEDIVKFTAKAHQVHNIKVIHKDDLLSSAEERATLADMTWDQHGALDWEVLSRASYFSGPVFSSFAWNIAIRRHVYNEDHAKINLENPLAGQEDDPTLVWEDGLSKIILRSDTVNPLELVAVAGMLP